MMVGDVTYDAHLLQIGHVLRGWQPVGIAYVGGHRHDQHQCGSVIRAW